METYEVMPHPFKEVNIIKLYLREVACTVFAGSISFTILLKDIRKVPFLHKPKKRLIFGWIWEKHLTFLWGLALPDLVNFTTIRSNSLASITTLVLCNGWALNLVAASWSVLTNTQRSSVGSSRTYFATKHFSSVTWYSYLPVCKTRKINMLFGRRHALKVKLEGAQLAYFLTEKRFFKIRLLLRCCTCFCLTWWIFSLFFLWNLLYIWSERKLQKNIIWLTLAMKNSKEI